MASIGTQSNIGDQFANGKHKSNENLPLLHLRMATIFLNYLQKLIEKWLARFISTML
jgi:hypothetical protein